MHRTPTVTSFSPLYNKTSLSYDVENILWLFDRRNRVKCGSIVVEGILVNVTLAVKRLGYSVLKFQHTHIHSALRHTHTHTTRQTLNNTHTLHTHLHSYTIVKPCAIKPPNRSGVIMMCGVVWCGVEPCRCKLLEYIGEPGTMSGLVRVAGQP